MSIKLHNETLIVGINWGAIEEKGWFGAKEFINVDLDLNCVQVNSLRQPIEIINWENKEGEFISLSKDDNVGDIKGNDFLDNEYAEINLPEIGKDTEVLLFASNYTEQELGKLGHFDYRLYTGEPNKHNEIIYFKNLADNPIYDQSKGVFLGVLRFNRGEWYYYKVEEYLHEIGYDNFFKEVMELYANIKS